MAHVLVAEDNGDVANALALLLETEGHEVHVVEDGVAALIEAERRLPDAAVLDVGLPFLNGIEVAYNMRQQYGDTLRLIACTGYDDDATRSKIMQAGFDVVLTKPAPADELLDAVASADLRRGRSASDRRQRRRPGHVAERFR
jgi:two-component system CheB/CheR fusion protein